MKLKVLNRRCEGEGVSGRVRLDGQVGGVRLEVRSWRREVGGMKGRVREISGFS